MCIWLEPLDSALDACIREDAYGKMHMDMV